MTTKTSTGAIHYPRSVSKRATGVVAKQGAQDLGEATSWYGDGIVPGTPREGYATLAKANEAIDRQREAGTLSREVKVEFFRQPKTFFHRDPAPGIYPVIVRDSFDHIHGSLTRNTPCRVAIAPTWAYVPTDLTRGFLWNVRVPSEE